MTMTEIPSDIDVEEYGARAKEWLASSAPKRGDADAEFGARGEMGSDEILLNIIGERVLGLPQDPRVDKDVPFKEIKAGTVRG